jgi:phosphotransferase system HPr (HPr) family protein
LEVKLQKFTVVVVNEVGLHARPAALFVQCAGLFQSKIMVRNVTSERDFVDAKSILGVLVLCVKQDHAIEITVEGEDEVVAAETLKKLIESDFTELPEGLPTSEEAQDN